ncbi:MAG: DedA family protein [Syntrophaceae bacterium]|nr:DedA family protein [Syntrophaceae bacterium]
MSLEMLISTYGYPSVAVGTFFEGEIVLVLAGFAAHRGYLSLSWVIVCAFLGTLCGDQLYFHLGRLKGTKFLDKRPQWKSRSARVFELMHKHPLLLVLGFRFVYGLRTITPFLLGTSGISSLRFFIWNSLGACVWAILIGVSGYLFGHALELLIGDIKRYELYLFIALAVSGAIIWSIHQLRKKRD